ncbi:MAG: hypothetical protein LBE80_01040, partial [Deltaproteobacteria bacterium]|nr:hypothetical protein [Deltaproteobacteria bacterium]
NAAEHNDRNLFNKDLKLEPDNLDQLLDKDLREDLTKLVGPQKMPKRDLTKPYSWEDINFAFEEFMRNYDRYKTITFDQAFTHMAFERVAPIFDFIINKELQDGQLKAASKKGQKKSQVVKAVTKTLDQKLAEEKPTKGQGKKGRGKKKTAAVLAKKAGLKRTNKKGLALKKANQKGKKSGRTFGESRS